MKSNFVGKSDFLLAIDIGNTSISYGLFKSGALIKRWYGNSYIIPKIDRFINNSGGFNNNYKVIISSVNPNKYKKIVSSLVKRVRKADIYTIGTQINPKINHKYIQINKLGKDRLVNLYGANRLYRKPLLMINFGTATTFDYLSKSGIYEGGLIIPGIEISFEALQEKAALLPKVGNGRDRSLQSSPKNRLIGRNTKSCMVSGLLQGFGAMADGLIDRFQSNFGGKFQVLASGGLSGLIRPYVKSRMKVDQTHTLKSLALIYDHCISQKQNFKLG